MEDNNVDIDDVAAIVSIIALLDDYEKRKSHHLSHITSVSGLE